MRQPAIPPADSPLQVLIAALPVEALRPLVLALLQISASSGPPLATPADPAPLPRRASKRRGGWPLGKPRGRGPGRPPKAEEAGATLDPKLLARRQRAAERARAKRAAARQAKADPSSSNGSAKITPAQALWQHAEALAPAFLRR